MPATPDLELSRRPLPSYPPEAVAWFVERLGLGRSARVFDLAAGTGKLMRLLVPTGAEVAVEPVAGMRAAFRELSARSSSDDLARSSAQSNSRPAV